jgi:hypothetical protein
MSSIGFFQQWWLKVFFATLLLIITCGRCTPFDPPRLLIITWTGGKPFIPSQLFVFHSLLFVSLPGFKDLLLLFFFATEHCYFL